MKAWLIITILLIFVGVIYVYNNPEILTNIKLQIRTETPIEEINNNPATYENNSVKVSGKLFSTIPDMYIYESEDVFENPKTIINHKIVDTQGYYLYLTAPGRDLIDYVGKDLTIEGTIKSGYDCKGVWGCNFLYYIELSKIF